MSSRGWASRLKSLFRIFLSAKAQRLALQPTSWSGPRPPACSKLVLLKTRILLPMTSISYCHGSAAKEAFVEWVGGEGRRDIPVASRHNFFSQRSVEHAS